MYKLNLSNYSQMWPLVGRQLFSVFMIVSNKYNNVQKIDPLKKMIM